MKIFYILSILLLTGQMAYSQNLDDAVRFSRLSNYGSARSAAMGGAFGALGGDITSLSYNPGGIGVFRKSEIAFTPLLNFDKTNSGNGDISRSSFQIGQLGAVFALSSSASDWKSVNFGINYTNMNNFNRKTDQLVGYSETSLTNVWAFNSRGLAPDSRYMDLGSILAYDTRLLYCDSLYDYFSVLEQTDDQGIYTLPVTQHKTTKESGYQGEYAFSFGANYKDKLYVGMTIGLQSVYYKMTSTYLEAPDEYSPSYLDAFYYDEELKINGVGTNLKFGLIYRPIPQIRIGAAIHTPTWYNMSYDYTAAIDAYYWEKDPSFDIDDYQYYSNGYYSIDYNMRTPWRAILGVATVVNQRAILSMDYEYVNYTSANFSDANDNTDYQYLNQDIKDVLRATHNIRVGAEVRANSIISLRGGYAYQASPYEYSTKENQLHSISAGIGLNFGMFYCDAAYVHKYSKNQTYFYSGVNPYQDNLVFTSEPVTNKYYTNEARVTLGIRF